MKILVTGATGNIGSLVTRRLIGSGYRPCVLVRDEAKAQRLFSDEVEIRVGNLAGDQKSLSAAFRGIDSLFLVNSGPDLADRDLAAALAAKSSGVRHVVKLSTLDVQTNVGTGSWHARGEAALRESGVDFTFVRSAAFMSNALYWADEIKAEGVLRSSTGDGKIAFIHPGDIADVAVHVLINRDQLGEALVITGPQALTYAEMVNIIGEAIGKVIRFISATDTQARMGSDPYSKAIVDIWRAIREGRVETMTDGVKHLLGREPRSFKQWVAENVGAFSTRGKSQDRGAQF